MTPEEIACNTLERVTQDAGKCDQERWYAKMECMDWRATKKSWNEKIEICQTWGHGLDILQTLSENIRDCPEYMIRDINQAIHAMKTRLLYLIL